jgi:uroporphyrinogen-III decarboxylase
LTLSPRQRFLTYVRAPQGARPVISPFLPFADVIERSLRHLGLPVSADPFQNEVVLSHALDYEPMFMTDCEGLIFPWQEDPVRSDDDYRLMTIQTPVGEWTRRVSRSLGEWGDDSGFPVKTEADHAFLVAVCEQIQDRVEHIREYYREWRRRIGEDGVIVIGHPHPFWLSFQISQQNIFLHYFDFPDTFRRSMDAIYTASLVVMDIAMQEGIDFMSTSSYGLEMTSHKLCREMDLPYIRAYTQWTHERDGLFWYHNCGLTRAFIRDGIFNEMQADVIETISSPPSGDNDLAESRRWLDRRICTKGNLDLGLLRDGTAEQVADATRKMVEAVRGFPHIFSTADAVLPNTPAENYIAFVRTAREMATAM